MEVEKYRLSKLPFKSAIDIKASRVAQSHTSEVQASAARLSLRCPISFARMSVPIRFENCKHLQCVDEFSWDSHKSSISFGRKLRCPVCDRLLEEPANAFIDGFTLDILKSTAPHIREAVVDIEKNYEWCPVEIEETTSDSE